MLGVRPYFSWTPFLALLGSSCWSSSSAGALRFPSCWSQAGPLAQVAQIARTAAPPSCAAVSPCCGCCLGGRPGPLGRGSMSTTVAAVVSPLVGAPWRVKKDAMWKARCTGGAPCPFPDISVRNGDTAIATAAGCCFFKNFVGWDFHLDFHGRFA